MALSFADFRNRAEIYLAVEDKDRLSEPVDDFESEVRASDQFEVQIDHHIEADAQDLYDFEELLPVDVLEELGVDLRAVLGVLEDELFGSLLEVGANAE